MSRLPSVLARAALLVTTALWAGCTDYAELPTDLEGGRLRPQWIEGDGPRPALGEGESAPVSCSALPTKPVIAIGTPASLCMPVAGDLVAVHGLTVRATQAVWSEQEGRYVRALAFEAIDLSEALKTDPVTEAARLFPTLLPTDTQAIGAVRIVMTLMSEDSITFTDTTSLDLRSVPTITITEPVPGTILEPGQTAVFVSEIDNASRIRRVFVEWRGAVTSSETVRLPDEPTTATLEHALYIPESAAGKELTMHVSIEDANGEGGEAEEWTYTVGAAASP